MMTSSLGSAEARRWITSMLVGARECVDAGNDRKPGPLAWYVHGPPTFRKRAFSIAFLTWNSLRPSAVASRARALFLME
jgi:hypothetical protein